MLNITHSQNRWKKRGIAIVPTKFGIAFTVLFLNQAGALIIVYADGSVLLSHGGVEMGQGLHTKMIQVASRALGISVKKIHISETATDKVPNTSATAASAGSDLNGMAVKVFSIFKCYTQNQNLLNCRNFCSFLELLKSNYNQFRHFLLFIFYQ